MSKLTLLKLWAAGMCALVACLLPQTMAKAHEIDVVAVRPIQALQALSQPKLLSFSELSPVDVPAPVQAAVVTPVTNCGNDPLMAYIYQKESGCSSGAVNEIGCRGLGQACPGGKLPCGNDWACQDSWFRQYAVSAYGSIYGAYLFRTSHNWW